MYAGRMIEMGTTDDIFYRPQHPYTSALIGSVPPVTGDLTVPEPLPGGPPNLSELPPGCSLAPRCPRVIDPCTPTRPPPQPRRTPAHDLRPSAACLRSTDPTLLAKEETHD